MTEAAAIRPPDSRRVLAGYFTLAGLYTLSAAAIWGVNTLFLLDAGLSFFEVFVANAAFSAGMVVFEVPTGVVADTLGRRVSFLLSVAVLAATTLLYVALAEVGAGVVAFAAVSVGMGLGFTFYSGAMEAWLVDALAATGYAGVLDRVFARGPAGHRRRDARRDGRRRAARPDRPLAALRRPLGAPRCGLRRRVGRDARPRLHAPPGHGAPSCPAEIARNARAGVHFGWSQPSLRLLMLASLVQMGFLTWAFYASQPYLLDLLESDAIWVAGLVASAIALSTIAGNQLVQVLSRRCGRRTTLLLGAAVVETCAAVVLGLAGSFWVALPALLLVTAARRRDEPRPTGVPAPGRADRAARDRRVVRLDGLQRRRRRRPAGPRGARRGALAWERPSSQAASRRRRRSHCSRGCARSAGRPTGSAASPPEWKARAPPRACRTSSRSRRRPLPKRRVAPPRG